MVRLGPSAVVASTRERARRTAEIVAERLDLCVRTLDALDEVDFGAWTGSTFEELAASPEWRAFHRTRREPPGIESLSAVQERMLGALETLRREHPDGLVVAVGHADPIKLALAGVLGLAREHLVRFEVAPASIQEIELDARIDGSDARVLRVGDTAHFEAAEAAPERGAAPYPGEGSRRSDASASGAVPSVSTNRGRARRASHERRVPLDEQHFSWRGIAARAVRRADDDAFTRVRR